MQSDGTRWAPRVKPATLQLLMRHASIETTLKYYVSQDASDVAEELWRAMNPLATPGGSEGQGEHHAAEGREDVNRGAL